MAGLGWYPCGRLKPASLFRTLIHPSSGACDFSIVSPHWLCVLVSMCVAVSVWLVGVVSVWKAPDDGCINLLTPNDDYSGRTAPLTYKCCILYIYSTNTGTEYFKHGIYSPSFALQNAFCFINLTYLVPVLFTFYTQGVLKCKKK